MLQHKNDYSGGTVLADRVVVAGNILGSGSWNLCAAFQLRPKDIKLSWDSQISNWVLCCYLACNAWMVLKVFSQNLAIRDLHVQVIQLLH